MSVLDRLLGPDVRWAVRRPGDVPASALRPEEAAAVERAVEKRKREMAAGRDAAREALSALGFIPATLPRGPGGAPVWPDGVVGSITHTDDWCLATVARRDSMGGLGVDAEPDAPIEADLWPSITTADELRVLEAMDADRAGRLARRIFCAKEAAYKAQYPRSGTLLEFDDLEIRFSEPNPSTRPMTDRFDAAFRRTVPGFAAGDLISGRLIVHEQRLVAAAFLAATFRAPGSGGSP